MAKSSSTNPNGSATPARVAGIGPREQELLRSIVERVERLHEERRALSADIAVVFQEAKGNGFDLPALRLVIRRRAMDADDREELDQLSDLYDRALRGEPVDLPAAPAGRRSTPMTTPPHGEARAAGKADALARVKTNDHRWPPGVYGHADYHLGFSEGERERDGKVMPKTSRPRFGVDFEKIENGGNKTAASRGRGRARDTANGTAPPPVEANPTARADGYEDGLLAVKDHAARWEGTSGAADYAFGQTEGQQKRGEALRLGGEAGRRGEDAETCPYPAGSSEAALWQARWLEPEPGRGQPPEAAAPAPKRRARKAAASQAASP